MARKKIIFVIVEGPSDDEALGVILNRLFSENTLHVEIIHGDITSDFSVYSHNIVAKIGNIVKDYAKKNYFRSSDFQEVIHLIDMDGAYIDDCDIIKKESQESVYYTTDHIYTCKPEDIIYRNQHKRENINRLCSLHKVWGSIPYRAYYMSSNLDHVLYNKLNSTDEDKEHDAYKFAKKYKDHLDDFLVFISDSDFSVCDEFEKSWDYIKEEKRSLERYTNLGLCFKEIRKNRQKAIKKT